MIRSLMRCGIVFEGFQVQLKTKEDNSSQQEDPKEELPETPDQSIG